MPREEEGQKDTDASRDQEKSAPEESLIQKKESAGKELLYEGKVLVSNSMIARKKRSPEISGERETMETAICKKGR